MVYGMCYIVARSSVYRFNILSRCWYYENKESKDHNFIGYMWYLSKFDQI